MSQESDVRAISGPVEVPPRPVPVPIQFDNIPAQLRELPNWVVWKYEFRRNAKGQGKWTKVPFCPWVDPGSPHRQASSVDRETWGTYQTTTAFFHEHEGEVDGIGFMLHGTGYTGVDFDHCRDARGELDPWVKGWVAELNTYSEVSPSGTGIKCIAIGTKPAGRCRNARVEMYDTGRFFTITGNVLGTPKGVANRQAVITSMHALEFRVQDKPTVGPTCTPPPSSSWLPPDQDIITRAGAGKNGDRFKALWGGDVTGYPSHSEADQALCNMLAFWVKHDPARVDHLYRQSRLYRDKWERDDYRAATLGKACSGGACYPWDREELAAREVQVAAVFDRADGDKGFHSMNTPSGALGDVADGYKGPQTVPPPAHEDDDQAGEKYAGWERERKKPAGGYTFAPLTSADFATRTYRIDWLVKRVLVRGQPCIIGGPKKVLKTSTLIDLVLSLGTGTPFLGHFPVPTPARTVLISGESGEHTIQETARRVCRAKGIDLGAADVLWDFRLPQLSVAEEVAELSRGLREARVEVAVIDPLYLCLLAGQTGTKNAGNLYDMGPLLLAVSRACLDAGATPLLAHHARKNLSNGFDPLDLDDLSFSGVQEFARQWMLLSRREPYTAGSGSHALWLVAGGSVGHGGVWGVDIEEGTLADDFTGRGWKVSVTSQTDIKEFKAAEKENKAKVEADTDRDRFLSTLTGAAPHERTKTAFQTRLGWRKSKFDRVLSGLLDGGRVVWEDGTITTGNGASRAVQLLTPRT